VAEALRDWLPVVLQAAKPWMSAADVEKGSRWETEIMGKLDEADVGIVCLTPENLDRPWLLFEAGALSKKLGKARVCIYLLDLAPAQVPQPLGMFQHTVIEKGETRKLLETINRGQSSPIEKDILDAGFGALWPKLEDKLNHIPQPGTEPKPKRELDDMVEEILGLVRELSGGRDAENLEARWEAASDAEKLEAIQAGRLSVLGLRRDKYREQLDHLKARALELSDAGDHGLKYADIRDRMAIGERELKAVEAEIDSVERRQFRVRPRLTTSLKGMGLDNAVE
jgi:TIR domain